jgi:hypothetical protein
MKVLCFIHVGSYAASACFATKFLLFVSQAKLLLLLGGNSNCGQRRKRDFLFMPERRNFKLRLIAEIKITIACSLLLKDFSSNFLQIVESLLSKIFAPLFAKKFNLNAVLQISPKK